MLRQRPANPHAQSIGAALQFMIRRGGGMNRSSLATAFSVSWMAAMTTTLADERVLVLDFGAQYAQLISRRVRENNVYCEIVRHDITPEQIRRHAPRGLILSGGPSSVYENGAQECY